MNHSSLRPRVTGTKETEQGSPAVFCFPLIFGDYSITYSANHIYTTTDEKINSCFYSRTLGGEGAPDQRRAIAREFARATPP